MLLQERDQDVFKRWLLPKLEDISDAEATVLADYVTALVLADAPEANVRRNCVESLEEFLGDNTEPVVNDVIAALRDKSYLPKSTPDQAKPPVPQSIRSIVGNANFEYEPHPSDVPFGAPRGPAATRFSNGSHTQALHNLQQDGSNLSRKRKLAEGDAGQGPESHYNRNGGGNNRPLKQTSRGRGGRNARGGGMEAQNNFSSFPGMPNFANFPPPPSGPLPFDPTDPTAFFAMAAAFGANLSPMSSLPVLNQGRGLNKKKGKCSDYHNIGFCALGNFCQYEHGGTIEDVLEYDPEQSFLAVQPDAGLNKQTAPRSQSSELNGVRLRMKFSQQGKPYNTTNTTIVVEPIPKEYCDEDNVRDFFSHFGNIVDIEMDTHRRLAIVKFDDNAAAAGAYTSPKAIFDNRFVKVYWYNPTDFERPPPTQTYGDTDMKDGNDGEEKLDPEEIAKRQAEAQQAFDERRRKADKAEARAADIERKLKEKNEEMEQIRKQLAELSGDKADEFSQNLAELQAEADSLFAQHEPSTSARGGYVGRGRGATFSALGGYFPPNGRGYTAFRGAHRGRVRFPSTLPRNPNKKLDNRPRRLAVMGIEAGTARDEALRQHLLNVTGCTSIERHPEQTNTLILTFEERYEAESFLDQSLNIPDIGKLALAWVPNDAFGGLKAVTTTTEEEEVAADNDDDDDSSATVGEHEIKGEEEQAVKVEMDADLDVADDVDQWL